MSVRQNRATQLLENPLLLELMDDHEHGLFRRWAESSEPYQREQLYSQYQALRELRSYLNNKCEGIAGGHE